MFQVCPHTALQAFLANVENSAENDTYSIDLSSSWTNDTVRLNRINKTAPVLN
jgi:hypothetical protein